MKIKTLLKNSSRHDYEDFHVAPQFFEDVTTSSISITSFDYGLDILPSALNGQDFGWVYDSFKKVTLVNLKNYQNKVNISMLLSAWRGTGYGEWEFLLSGWFIYAIIEALNDGKDTADISALFNRKLIARDGLCITKEDIHKILLPCFNVVEETDDELKLNLNIDMLSSVA